MIQFFRKIRQSLLSEGKTGRYFKYAIGEIVLVVIGILIALQINNWNEEHKINKIRTLKLSQIESDLRADVVALEEGILVKEQEIATLKNYRDRLSQSNASIDTLDKIVNTEFLGRIRIGFSGFNNITYISMIQSGELGILSDDLVKDLSILNIRQQNSDNNYNLHKEMYLKKGQSFNANYPVKRRTDIIGDGPLSDYLREHREDKNFIVNFNEVFIAKRLMYSQNLSHHKKILELTKAILKNHFAE
ncbi:DUF6090 family protein [Polaribacter sp.]|uniref:DUF6090 family protein n=1 Tax=Polaribacter sp. TaxID=1920175 RepID=UPI004048D5A2